MHRELIRKRYVPDASRSDLRQRSRLHVGVHLPQMDIPCRGCARVQSMSPGRYLHQAPRGKTLPTASFKDVWRK
eukprot:4759162-Pyramimonas_sp.AAC.1